MDTLTFSGQAVVPLGISFVYVALFLYPLLQQKLYDTAGELFAVYIFVSMLWHINLAAVALGVPNLIPGIGWTTLVPYGLIILGTLYWAFAHAFLQQRWSALWGWNIGLSGLVLILALHRGWFLTSPPGTAAANLIFIISTLWFGALMMFALAAAAAQFFQTKNPAHKNRIQYVLICLLLLFGGYAMFASLREPFWSIGLMVAGLGAILSTYIVTVEDLIDLSTGIRFTVRNLVVILVTMAVYIAGIYVVNIFLGDFLVASLSSGFLDRTFLVAVVTAVLLTVVYLPIRHLTLDLTNRLLFGQRYDYQMAVHNFSQTVSNILYLNELSGAIANQLDQAPGVSKSALFMVDSETETVYNLRSVLPLGSNGLPKNISLTKNTSITDRLINEGKQLTQYTIDISPHFRSAPSDDSQTLTVMNFERFVPILKNGELIGLLAVGTKKSGQTYTVQDIRLLSTLAEQTALALENATLFDRLQRNLEQTTRIKNLMDNVFESIDNGVITTDNKGRITFFNRAAQSILALPPKTSLGRSYTELLPALADTILPNLIENVTERENRYSDYEIITELPSRGEVDLNLSLAPLKDVKERTQGVAIVMDDLTETKRLKAVQDMFRCYVSPVVVDRLPSDPSELKLGGKRQMVTVLFADIRGFTSFGEKLSPEELVDVLNQYLSMAAASILMYEGTLDKFMGDAVMGIFNAPLAQEDHALRAIRAAAAMQRAVADHHKSSGQKQGLTFGVGLHMGEAVVGNVGMSDRMDYTAIGDTVNLAKRIQENSPGGKVLMSEVVYEAGKDAINAVFHKELQVKGRKQPVNTYELRSI